MHRLRARLSEDRGAVAVVVALAMTVAVGSAAISVDVGSLYAERRQLQNGADAAALAVACYGGTATQDAALATSMAGANANDGLAQAAVTVLSGGRVEVDTGTLTASGSTTLPMLFAPLLGVRGVHVSASATAQCGYPSAGRAALPLIFSYCAFSAQTGGGLPSSTQPYTVLFPKTDATACTGRSGNPVPGGFGWLAADAGGCAATTSLGVQAATDPGASISAGCTPSYVATLQARTVLLPLFEQKDLSGNNAWYTPSGYAAFTITGYFFGGQYSWNPQCSGNDRCITGYFLGFAGVDTTGFTYSPTAPSYGASVATLVG